MRTLFERGSLDHEYRFLKKDGSVIWIRDQLRLIEDQKGKEIVGAWTDITRRKETEEDLRESRERFDTLVNQLNDIVWTATADSSRITEVNPAFKKVYGISEAQDTNQPDAEARDSGTPCRWCCSRF